MLIIICQFDNIEKIIFVIFVRAVVYSLSLDKLMLEEPQTVLLFVFENVQVVRVPVEMVAVAADGGTTLLPFVVCFVVFAADEIAATG